MGLTDFVLPFVTGRSAEFSEQAEKIGEAINSLINAVSEMSANDTKRLLQKIDRFPTERLVELQQLAGRRVRQDVVGLSQRIQVAIERLPDDIQARMEADVDGDLPAASELERCGRELRMLTLKARGRQRRVYFVVGGVLALIPVLIYVAGVFQRLQVGMAPVSSEIVSPDDVYVGNSDGSSFTLEPEHRKAILSGFSRYYFYKSDVVPPPYEKRVSEEATERTPDPKEHDVKVRWKGVAQNRSGIHPFYFGDIEVAVTYTAARPFPWRELEVTPKLDVDATADQFVITSVGLGPALDVKWRAETQSGMVLYKGKRAYIWRAGPIHDMLEPDVVKALTDASGTLVKPLYLELTESPATGDARFREWEGTWYETITTAARLTQVTETSRGGELRVCIEYESLIGEKQPPIVERVELPMTSVFYRPRPKLRTYPPWPIPVTDLGHLTGMSAPGVSSGGPIIVPRLMAALIPQLSGGTPSGVDKLDETVEVDLSKCGEGETTTSKVAPDNFLNPKGILVLQVELSEPNNGTYTVEIRFHDIVADKFTIDVLRPPLERFEHSHIERFQSSP